MSFISPDDKPFKTDNLLDDFTIDVVNTNSFDEINCIIRGSSVSNNFGKINTKIPTFIIDENFVIDKFEEIIYITGDMKKFSRMKNKGLLPLIFVGSNGFLSKYVSNNSSKKVLSDSAAMPSMFVKFNAKNNSRPSMGSALMSVLALSKISNKINVYGWDLHLEKNISEMNYFEYIKFLLHTTSDRFGRKRDIRIQSVFEKIINLNYIYRMQLDSKFNIVSYASSIVDRKSLITNIQRAIYK